MNTIIEGGLAFDFDDDWSPAKLDDWAYYQGGTGRGNGFKDCCQGNKSVDIAALQKSTRTLWLIEVKDYRVHARTKPVAVWEEVAVKTRDSLACLLSARMKASGGEQALAAKYAKAHFIRVVLHLEQPTVHSRLFPRVFDLSHVMQRLKQLVKPIDAHPWVVDRASLREGLWSVRSVP